MPELVEVELYRRLAERALGRIVERVEAPDAWFLKGGLTADELDARVRGHRFVASRRIGKLLLLDTDDGPTVGLRFGMTGRLLVDGAPGIDELIYSSVRDEPAWDRVAFVFADGGDVRIRDPRRLGGVVLEPDEGRLGVDAATASRGELAAALAGSAAPLKARLLDQARVAGVGNLIADEVLWRAGLDPTRPAGSLDATELRRLHAHLRSTIRTLLERRGSHTGELGSERRPGGRCPTDGAELQRRTVGGRTTWSCPVHQR